MARTSLSGLLHLLRDSGYAIDARLESRNRYAFVLHTALAQPYKLISLRPLHLARPRLQTNRKLEGGLSLLMEIADISARRFSVPA